MYVYVCDIVVAEANLTPPHFLVVFISVYLFCQFIHWKFSILMTAQKYAASE